MAPINTGDIIIIENLEYNDQNSSRKWKDSFLLVRRAWRVDDITNGGKIQAHDMHGNRKTIHALDRFPCYPYIVKVISI